MCARSNPKIWQAVAVKGLINCSFLPLTQPSWMTGRKKQQQLFFQAWFGALNKCLMWNHLLTHLFGGWHVWSEQCQRVVSCQSELTFNYKSFTIQSKAFVRDYTRGAKVLICEARLYESIAVNAQSSLWKLLCAIYTFSFIHSFIVTADLASQNRISPKMGTEPK